jgi:GT2 family glycosyltransferase
VSSVRRHDPDVLVRIADDSPDSSERHAALTALEAIGCVVHPLPPNAGISAGRNALVDAVRTPYFVLTDDDKVFTRRTRLDRLQTVMEHDAGCIIAAGMNLDYGLLRRYQHGEVRQEGGHLRRTLYGSRAPRTNVGGVTCVPCRLTPNFFMGRTSLFRERRVRWDERFRVGHGEHAWFFANLPPDLRIYVVPEVCVSHLPTRWGRAEYRRFRYDPRELNRFTEVTGLAIDTGWLFESAIDRVRRSSAARLRGALERLAGR